MKEPKSLSFFVALWTGLGVAASMAAYAVFQFLAYPRMTLGSLFVEHLWHVLVLGAVIYGICWAVFRRVLIRPIRTIHMHLYAVGAGRVEPLELESDVTEIRMIVDGVNLMIQRMGHGTWPGAEGAIERNIERIRGPGRLSE